MSDMPKTDAQVRADIHDKVHGKVATLVNVASATHTLVSTMYNWQGTSKDLLDDLGNAVADLRKDGYL